MLYATFCLQQMLHSVCWALENNMALRDSIVNAAQLLLKRQFSSISGLQTPILQNTGFHIESYPAIQILFIG